MLEAAAAEPELDPEDLVHFSVGDLPSRGYGVMGEIRRQGKLCDVTLKLIPSDLQPPPSISCLSGRSMLCLGEDNP
ncbi:hypothetical protein AV530_019227 [Patagioenas fasciata monilis]|uniref:Uncharacterized protein n=1 Tax=Patagioenas fasciata monilis TaxID=372326 RepID=A0A1V4KV04_PATFA|nr:hypothetical protein AV530_019227 [Patagioenas fasciata monilis]